MQKSKKRGKSSEIPKPMKIKKEKNEEDKKLYSMAHYIDDRLELVKQIFSTLKPKTITNLAPDFLKTKDLEEIEELCLNELLCISTKRLKTIIAATKCPTDTESSSDSDINNVEEHISLEEISSDSEIDDGGANKARKKTNSCSTTAKKTNKNASKKYYQDGQISVLELLELQARARAIRSQLALEPVTKIEVDSGPDTDDDIASNSRLKVNKSGKKSESVAASKSKGNGRQSAVAKSTTTSAEVLPSPTTVGVDMNKGKNDEMIATAATATATTATAAAATAAATGARKKVILKRNFRSNIANTNGNTNILLDEDKANVNAIANAKVNTNFNANAINMPNSVEEIKEEHKSRSNSPDVIPIVPEPATFVISDSSDEDGTTCMGFVATVVPQSTDATIVGGDQMPESEQTLETANAMDKEDDVAFTEPEEGEIFEDGDESIEGINDATKDLLQPIHDSHMVACSFHKDKELTATAAAAFSNENVEENNDGCEDAGIPVVDDEVTKIEIIEMAGRGIDADAERSCEETSTKGDDEDEHVLHSVGSVVDELDDQIDDIISIEGDDISFEMTEQSESDIQAQETQQVATLATLNVSQVEEDAISLGSSDGDENKDSVESWNARWLKSSKVGKVLATSRLGKRVRDKIKQSKGLMQKDTSREGDAEIRIEKTSGSFTSKHEDGSMEQYKELLEMKQHQRKS